MTVEAETRPQACRTISKRRSNRPSFAILCRRSARRSLMSARRSPRSACPNAWHRAARRRRSATASACAGLYDRLAPHIFSATQVERGKPAPDLFLFAAEQMQAAPERCLVIEDSVPGITGARAAGMTVLGFHGGSHCRPGHADTLRAAGAVMAFDDMRQLPDLIGGSTQPVAPERPPCIPGWCASIRPGIRRFRVRASHAPE